MIGIIIMLHAIVFIQVVTIETITLTVARIVVVFCIVVVAFIVILVIAEVFLIAIEYQVLFYVVYFDAIWNGRIAQLNCVKSLTADQLVGWQTGVVVVVAVVLTIDAIASRVSSYYLSGELNGTGDGGLDVSEFVV